ncbi:MAG: transposase [Flavobacteriaceae bacterium]|nr:transposase [Flavobacteriaceae bacterium]
MEKYQNKYRTDSMRLSGYNYSAEGYYFVTICTQGRDHFFGEIIVGEMKLNPIGEIAYEQWHLSEKIRQNIVLDEFVIMPNHIHGIVIIDNHKYRRDVAAQRLYNAAQRLYETKRVYDGKHPEMSEISPKKTSLSHMIREYKTAVTKNAKKINHQFVWQSGFYDHIIRNNKSLQNIRLYIQSNPKMWHKDRHNKKGVWL